MLPEFNSYGDLPPGVHPAAWKEFETRFGASTLRRVWLLGRLRALLDHAASTGKLSRVFIGEASSRRNRIREISMFSWIMDESFESEQASPAAQAVFDSARAKLLFSADVFWARASIGSEALQLWLDTHQSSRGFRKRGIVD